MMGQKWAQKIQLGKESVFGTAVAASTIWRGVGGNLHDTREVEAVDEQIGMAVKSNRAYLSKVGGALATLSKRIGFRVAPGFSERVIFRELFPRGLTLLDLKDLGTEQLSMSNIAARQELRDLIGELNLPGVSIGF